MAGLLWQVVSFHCVGRVLAFIYGAAFILAAYVIATIWGAGIEMIALVRKLPHGLSHGSAFQETFIKVLGYSSAPTELTSFALILWGLRGIEEVSGK